MTTKDFSEELIAPCGINCRICIAYFGYTMSGKKSKKQCIGCNPSGKSCAHLKKYCAKLRKKEIEYCYECSDFPCEHLQRIDTAYRDRFYVSLVANLEYIRDNGMKKFLQEQEERYKCPSCQEVICVHNGKCYSCDN
jgi:hypothetical protein